MSPRNFARIFTKEMNSPPQDLWSASGLRRPADARQQVNAAMTVKAEGPEFWRQLLKELAIHANSQRFSVMCDEVRQEINGKLFVIGMYTPDMAVAQLPFVAPTLTFLLWLESDTPGNFQFQMTLNHLESGRVVAQGMGGVQIARPGVGITPIRMTGVPFTAVGAYTFAVKFEGQEALVTHFSIILGQVGVGGLQRPA